MGAVISQYTLYSETESLSDPEFFHVETIRSRARAFNWHIGIHRHPRLFQLIFINTGAANITLDNQSKRVVGPYLVTVPSSVVHGFEFDQDTTGYVVTVSNLVLEQDALKQNLVNYDNFISLAQACELSESGPDYPCICQLFDQLYSEYQHELPGKRAIFVWGLFGILGRMARSLPQGENIAPLSQSELKFIDIKRVIEANYRCSRAIADLAEELNLSTLSLNRLCHKVTGQSFKELLNSRIILEAQRLLIYSTAPVSSVAYELGFSDPAYFSRFFAKWVGLSPSEFRLRRQQAE
jgi:AraC family transcriptional activator of pobA